MIDTRNIKQLIGIMGFTSLSEDVFIKYYKNFDCDVRVDFTNKKIIYPEERGFKINDRTTCNFEHSENFVVFECVCRLLDKGYRPEHLELEKRWNLGHDAKGGKADICVYDKDGINMLAIIECKTDGREYTKELNNIKNDGGQVFSYWQQERSTKWLLLYSSNFDGKVVTYKTESINCSDDANILELAKKDNSIKVFKEAHSVNELFEVWSETYEKALCGDIMFGEDTQSYNIGIKPLRKKDLIDFSADDKIVNKFEEILRHNNVSDKENAFNRLIALFICKLVDEINKTDEDIVEFQYKTGTDTYESLQDRLQHLHQQGMDEFMKEKIFYVADDYAENLVKSYTGYKREKMIEDLRKTLRILKFYTNNDFAFKDVHNEELFYQNGKVLVEVVQLFEKYRIIESSNLQLLGDLFEQLLNKGFKQNEGQFFTPIPITRFIWDSLPLEKLVHNSSKIIYPKIIDYACGAGHFLTEGYEAICDIIVQDGVNKNNQWVEKKLYGIEKDYRLARVSKISLFMHGAGNGNIIFGDGLENYPEKNISSNEFDILVANPPYSVSAFKPHLNLKNNTFELLDLISNDGSEIETLFVERIEQLLKPKGIAAVILPSSILNKENNSFIKARESILKNFYIRAIVQLGSKTFGATGTNTIVLFLEKYDEPPKCIDLIKDSVSAIFSNNDISDWEDKDILREYLIHIGVSEEEYVKFIMRKVPYEYWKTNDYFKMYVDNFESSTEFVNKKKQKVFMRLPPEKQLEWFNARFYELTQDIEKEKVQYFALVYKQKILVISAPSDNKEQEKFLGYKWSNRKGSEGIQMIKEGGMLYDNTNRRADNTLATVVRKSFEEKKVIINELEDYYYYLRLQDMLDFSNVTFNKSLKITRVRKKRVNQNLKSYNLSDEIFDISIGNRVLSSELIDNGHIPVYSANVFEIFGYTNKQNLTDFSKDSIIWGIDGDWMVNYIPAGRVFYPTDHCGVLRINSNAIIPKYMAIALQVEGEYEKFSRSNRASIQRIKNLTIQVPEKNEQEKIVDLVEKIDEKINSQKCIIKNLSDAVKLKFTEMFENINTQFPEKKLGILYEFQIGKTPARNKVKYWNSPDYKWISVADMKNYDRFTSKTAEHITQLAVDESGIKIVPANTVIMSFKLTIGRTAITSEEIYTNEAIVAFIDKHADNISNDYLRVYLSMYDWTSGQMNAVKGMTLNKTSLGNAIIKIPPTVLQNEFEDYVEQVDKLKLEAQKKIEELQKEREEIIHNYF